MCGVTADFVLSTWGFKPWYKYGGGWRSDIPAISIQRPDNARRVVHADQVPAPLAFDRFALVLIYTLFSIFFICFAMEQGIHIYDETPAAGPKP
jgi:hypothetical protein